MLLSVIIPAYNVERYVQACLDSVFALPLSESEMEVLVIDDGSTDNTPQILAENALRHSNLRVMRQPNQGQSVARNWGIEEAQGEYILFVDADDELTEPCPLPWVEMKSGKYDMIGLETLFEDTQGRRRYCRQIFPYDQEFPTCADYLKAHNVLGLVYGYVFRTQFIKTHSDLRFTPGIYHQDEEFVVKAFCLGKGFVYKQGYTYVYYKREGSSIHTDTRERKETLMNHMMIVLHQLKDFAKEKGFPDTIQCKMGWMTLDVFRLLVRQRHTLLFSMGIFRKLVSLGMIPDFVRSVPYFISYHHD
mgnify:CR=1 FL=1